jgi:hypothetical protein
MADVKVVEELNQSNENDIKKGINHTKARFRELLTLWRRNFSF